MKKNIVPLTVKRPISQLQKKVRIKVFNYITLVDMIQKANKIMVKSGSTEMSILYFSVYVEDGNNSEMIKASIRKRSGWRVVEIPAVAHMIWSQSYRVKYDKKLSKKYREIETLDKLGQQSNNKIYMNTINSTTK